MIRAFIATISLVMLVVGLWQTVNAPDPRLEKAVVILAYHEIDPKLTTRWSRSPEDLKRDIEVLTDAGVRFYSLDQLIEARQADRALPTPGVVLTFDDATVGQYRYAYPLLQQHRIPATFYVPTEWVIKQAPGYAGYREMMSVNQLRELTDQGYQLASHSHRHRPFATIDTEKIRQDIALAHQYLRDELGVATRDFCLPNGSYRAEHEDLLTEAGYRSVALTTTFHGAGNAALIKLRRTEIKRNTPSEEVLRLVESGRI